MTKNIVQLSSGQLISYARYGRVGGKPAFYFHGLPGSSCEGELLHHACNKYGIDLIAPDRFGYGRTPPCEGDRYLSWVNNINELADQLRFDKFYLLAASGGSPYALACASLLSQRIIATGICCGLGSLALPELRRPMLGIAKLSAFLARHSPGLLKNSIGISTSIAARYFYRQAIPGLGYIIGGRDKMALNDPNVRRIMIENIKTAFAQGSSGGIADLVAAGKPWPFDVMDIKHLQLWHGSNDKIVPLAHSQWLVKQVPSASLKIVPDEGHFSLPILHIDEVVKNLVELH